MSHTLAEHPTRPSGPAEGAAHAVAPTAVQPASLRLTRRGRLVVLVLLTVAVFALISAGRVWAQAEPTPAAGTSSSSAPVTSTWVVQPGETLWSVAVAVDPDTDPRETVARIIDLNALSDTGVVAGQSLLVPA